MNYEDFKILNNLKTYFDENCKELVFANEMPLENDNRAKMYYVNADAITERNNYKKIFQEYLLLYARSYEKLRYFKHQSDDLSVDLIDYGKDIWNNDGLIITGDINSSGIFGELFNDFYLNIVKNENILLTYSSKRGFAEKNIKGVDVVGCICENKKLTLIYSESKFVQSAYDAQKYLRDDIKGKETEPSHITSEYINKFSSFLLDKNHSLYKDSTENMEIIINNIDLINDKIYNKEKPIDIFNELEVKIRFVFFAVYKDNKFTAAEREDYFNNILSDFNSQIIKIGLKKYDVEIVFIPIINKSTEIKEYMCKWD